MFLHLNSLLLPVAAPHPRPATHRGGGGLFHQAGLSEDHQVGEAFQRRIGRDVLGRVEGAIFLGWGYICYIWL